MIATIIGALTSRIAGPAATVAAVILAGVAVGQCSEKNAEARRADRAENAAEVATANLSTCRSNVSGLQASIDGQNALLAAKSAEDAQRLAEAGKRLSEAQRGRDGAEARAAALLKNPPAGVDACARAMTAFQAVKEQTR